MDSIRPTGAPIIAPQTSTSGAPAPAADESPQPNIHDGFTASNQDSTTQAIRDMRTLSAALGAHPTNHPAPSDSPAPAGNPAPSGSPIPAGSPAPSGSPAPAGSPAPSDSPAPAGNPNPPLPPAPPNPPVPPQPQVEAPSFGEKAEIACGCFNAAADGITSTAEAAGISAAAGAIAGAAGFAAAGVGLTALGAFQLGKGIKDHDAEGAIGGSATLLDGVGNSASAVNIAAAESTAGQIAGRIAAPFSGVSAVISTGLGIKELHDGIKKHSKIDIVSGALNLALGVSNAASALGGGIPAVIATSVIIVGKIALAAVKSHLAHRQNNNPPAPPVPPQPQPSNGPNPPAP